MTPANRGAAGSQTLQVRCQQLSSLCWCGLHVCCASATKRNTHRARACKRESLFQGAGAWGDHMTNMSTCALTSSFTFSVNPLVLLNTSIYLEGVNGCTWPFVGPAHDCSHAAPGPSSRLARTTRRNVPSVASAGCIIHVLGVDTQPRKQKLLIFASSQSPRFPFEEARWVKNEIFSSSGGFCC